MIGKYSTLCISHRVPSQNKTIPVGHTQLTFTKQKIIVRLNKIYYL